MKRPRFIAEQARHAKGPLGRFVAFVMARETFAGNMRAIDALDVQPHDRVLDIGCGHGRSLGVLAARATGGHVAGADPSALMTEIAVERNRKLVKKGRIEVAIAGADHLPFADGTFDKALCIQVTYFWKHLDAALQEIARVMKPQGRLALMFRTDADKAATRAFPANIYCFRSLAETVAALEAAGFAVDTKHDPAAGQPEEPVLLLATKRAAGSGS
ncbi:MAG: methyltransferase domain-containing protein [Parvibaculum sp.]|uniref:class I SAM-dependent methyltransferase n=2 Tax=Parvibaculum sp. TaxID=2024848 RepID=UPI0032667A35